jgi:hypothetical protein
MLLKEEENIIKTFHHHYTAMLVRAFKYLFVMLPFYLVAYVISSLFSPAVVIMIYCCIAIFFTVFIAYDLFLYYMDKLVITNYRIIHVDWKSIFRKEESEVEIKEIQDITTVEHGLFAIIPFFDYGFFNVETASSKTALVYDDAPDPTNIKHFIYHLNIKPTRIGAAGNLSSTYDPAREETGQESFISGSR